MGLVLVRFWRDLVPNVVMEVIISSVEARVPFRTGGKWAGAVIRVKIRGWLPDMAGNLHAQISKRAVKVILPNRA
jgi:hypothetical protein